MSRSLKIVASTSAVVFMALALLFRLGGHLPGESGLAEYLADPQSPLIGHLATIVTSPYGFAASVGLIALVAGIHSWRDGLLLGTLLLVAIGNDAVLKPVIGRTRGLHLALTFPSGHATAAALLAVGITCVTAWRWPTRRLWAITAMVGCCFALFVGWWLLAERDHLPADVLGSYCLAIFVGCALHGVRLRRLAHRPASTGPGQD